MNDSKRTAGLRGRFLGLALSLLAVFLIWPDGLKIRAEETEDSFTILFFHETSCATCNGTQEFFDVFNEAVGDIKEQYHYEIDTINVFQESGNDRLKEELARIGKTRQDVSVPCVIIGEDVLCGLEEIRNGIRDIFVKYGEGYKATYQEAETEEEDTKSAVFDGIQVDPDAHTICFFYTLSCDDCERVKKYLADLETEIDGKPVEVQSYSIAEADGIEKVRAMFDAYDVPESEQQVPIIFSSKGYLSGGDAIINGLEKALGQGDFLNFAYPKTGSKIEPLKARDLPAIALTGFINGFNPCSISILFLLLSLIMMDKSRILKVGFTFMAGKFVTYFLLGIGLYSLVSVIDFVWIDKVQLVLNIVLIGAALYLAVLNMLDFFATLREDYGKVRAQLPQRLRRFNNNIIKKVMADGNRKYLLLMIFLAAILISAGEFLCTGQIYLGTIIYMLNRGSDSRMLTVLAFVLYIAAMCLPQCIMILAVRGGANVMNMTESTRKRFPIIKLVNCLVFLAFAGLMIWMTFIR